MNETVQGDGDESREAGGLGGGLGSGPQGSRSGGAVFRWAVAALIGLIAAVGTWYSYIRDRNERCVDIVGRAERALEFHTEEAVEGDAQGRKMPPPGEDLPIPGSLFEQADELGCKGPSLERARGLFLWRSGQSKRAQSVLKSAVDLYPEDLPLAHTWGFVSLSIMDYPTARIAFQSIVDRQECFGTAEYNLGIIELDELPSGRGELSRGTTFLERAVECNPQDAAGYYHLGNAYLYGREFGRAVKNLSEAISLQRDFAAGYYQRALAHRCVGNADLAKRDAEQCLRFKPSDEDCISLLSKLEVGTEPACEFN